MNHEFDEAYPEETKVIRFDNGSTLKALPIGDESKVRGRNSFILIDLDD